MAMSVGEEQQHPVSSGAVTIGRHRYLRAPVPVHFPEYELVPESKRHELQRTLLRDCLRHAFAREANIGSDQFVYWDPTNPRACLAPDAFVRLGQADCLFKTWMVWERGAPEVAVEIVSYSDAPKVAWEIKLGRYLRLGVKELVRFDPGPSTQRLRIWDRIENDLVERALGGPSAESGVLPAYWVESLHPELGPTLRLSHDAEGSRLYPTEAEAHRAEAEAHRAEAEAHRAEAEAATLRIREFEAELQRRQG